MLGIAALSNVAYQMVGGRLGKSVQSLEFSAADTRKEGVLAEVGVAWG
jgi:hypothetical protein